MAAPCRRAIRPMPAKAGLALVPEDRRREGLVLDQGLAAEYIAAPISTACALGGWPIFSRSSGRCALREIPPQHSPSMRAARARKPPNSAAAISRRWSSRNGSRPRRACSFSTSPPPGVDVNAKAEMRALMRRTAAEGRRRAADLLRTRGTGDDPRPRAAHDRRVGSPARPRPACMKRVCAPCCKTKSHPPNVR